MSLRGFGLTFDVQKGVGRNWYVGADGVTRWADDDQPVRCPKCDNPSRIDYWHICGITRQPTSPGEGT